MKFLADGRVYALLIILVGAGLCVFKFDKPGELLVVTGASLYQHPTKDKE